MADDMFKRQVLEATDLVELVSQSVSLKRRGKNYVGLCPFHQEKTPSFNVDPVKGYFKCFGCKASGNAIDFVIKRDRVTFLESLKSLAERAGLELPRFGVSKEKITERQGLLDLHARAADYFHRTLLSPIGSAARAYLEKRGFSQESITRFRLGFAPPGWDFLLRSKEMAGTPPGMLALAGLVKARAQGSGHYDTFRNRLMFPIRDEQGRTIAFGGRVMPAPPAPPSGPGSAEDSGPAQPADPSAAAKYLNSPETPLFSKSRSIFGLDLARQRTVETRTVAVVEGYTDVVMAHQFGASNVVSILGTAMTEQHLQMLRRFADRIVLLFDADTAGETAVNRSVELFLTQPVEIAIATLPGGLDPDEYLLQHGAPAFDELLRTAEDALSFKWRVLRREVDSAGNSLTAQQKAVEAYLGLLTGARASGPVDEIRWGAVLRRVERLTGIPIDQLSRRFASVSRRGPQGPRGGPQGTGQRGGGNGYQGAAASPPRGSVYGDQNATEPDRTDDAIDAPSDTTEARRPVDPALRRAERWILGILLAEPARWIHVQSVVSDSTFQDPDHQRVASFFWDRLRNEGEPAFNEFLSELPDDSTRSTAIELMEECEKLGDLEATLSSALGYLKEVRLRQEERRNAEALQTQQPGTPANDGAEIEMLRTLQKHMSRSDARRLGPG